MQNLLHFGMGVDRHRVEPPCSPIIVKEGFSAASDCMSVEGRICFVAIEKGNAIDVAHRHDRIFEAVLAPGFCRALLRRDCVLIDVVAGKSIFRRDEIGGHALWHEIGFDRDRGIDRPGSPEAPMPTRLIDSTPRQR